MSEIMELAARVVEGKDSIQELVKALEEAGVDEEDIERVIRTAARYVEAYEEGDDMAPVVFAAFVRGVLDKYSGEDNVEEVVEFSEEYLRERRRG